MKIGIDCRLINETGVGRYIKNLVLNLQKTDRKNDYVLFIRSGDERKIKIENPKFKTVYADVHWHSLGEQFNFPKIINSQNLDLMHFTYFSIPLFYYKPYVTTIHDVIVNKFNTGKASTLPRPLYLAKRAGYHLVLSNAVYRSEKIIVPSHAVSDDLKETYRNVNASKIHVIYEGGFDSNQKPKTKNRSHKGTSFHEASKQIIEGRYLLRVGNFYPHKNIDRLILAFKDFLFESYDNHSIKLVLVGRRDFFRQKTERKISALNLSENVVFIENATDADLENLYENAIATVVPSLMEGFSLTALEAMSLSCPVIVSDIPVHREVCGASAIYCNPLDVNDIKQKINFACSLIDSSRKELIEQGKKQANKFSWKKTAEETLALYESTAA